jgi:hypothetical protein
VFGDTGIKRLSDPAAPWYRGQRFDDLEQAMTDNATQADWNFRAIATVAKRYDEQNFLAVFVPLTEVLPKVDADGKSFSAGFFRGWVIIVDSKTREPLCQTQFSARSSAKVTDRFLRIGPHDDSGMKIGANMKKAVESDFTDNFWDAVNAAMSGIRK